MERNLRKLRGTLSLDLDGTCVHSGKPIQKNLIDALTYLQSRGMSILFNTGRNYSFATLALPDLKFPHYIAGQNGAVLVEGLSKKIIEQRNLPAKLIQSLDAFEEKFQVGFLLETGAENQDAAYYNPSRLTTDLQEYFDYRQKVQKITWGKVQSWSQFDTSVSMMKVFAKTKTLEELVEKIKGAFEVADVIIKDPFREGFGILLLNAKGVNKGSLLQRFFEKGLGERPCIAAGDDTSDIPMLKEAETALVADDAPDIVKQLGRFNFEIDELGDLLIKLASSEVRE